MTGLTHFNRAGEAQMVDVGGKAETDRSAVAEGCISMQAATLHLIEAGGHKKGDVLGIARIAGIMGAKRTAELVPLCHPLTLTRVDCSFEILTETATVRCRTTVATLGRTGVEMEALCGVQIALLTVYDMCKAVDRGMTISGIRLLEKRGGRSGHWQAEPDKSARPDANHDTDAALTR